MLLQLQYGSMVVKIIVVPFNHSRINFGSCAMVLIIAVPIICSSINFGSGSMLILIMAIPLNFGWGCGSMEVW